MLTAVDEKKIKKLIKGEVGSKLDSLQKQVTSIRGFVTNIREQVENVKDSLQKQIESVKGSVSEIQEQVEGVRGSVIKIERDRKILWDIWEFIKDHTRQLKDHEQRITSLESSPD